MEVKQIAGLGTTIDVCLVGGTIKEGDEVAVCTMEGPLVTTVRSVLTPEPAKESRVKGSFVHHKEMKGAMGVKICAHGLEKALAGTQMLVKHADDDVEDLKHEVQKDYDSVMKAFDMKPIGVWVQASTIGSLEALLEYLRSHEPPVPVSGVSIGTVHSRDVKKASVMLDRSPDYAVMLCFDVEIHAKALEEAEGLGVTIFTADIIYHLTDAFEKYSEERKMSKRAAAGDKAVFPAVVTIRNDGVYKRRNPMLLGVDCESGELRIGTPLAVLKDGKIMRVGVVTSMKQDDVDKPKIKQGESAAIQVTATDRYGTPSLEANRHFTTEDPLVSHISRESIEALKVHYKDEVTKDMVRMLIKLKKWFNVI